MSCAAGARPTTCSTPAPARSGPFAGDVLLETPALGLQLVDAELHHVTDADHAAQRTVLDDRHVTETLLGHQPLDLVDGGVAGHRAYVGGLDRGDRLGQHG